MYNVWLTMSFFLKSWLFMIDVWLITWRILRIFEKFSQLKNVPFKSFYSLFFEQCFPCQDSTSIYGAWKLSFAEILLKYSRTLSKLNLKRHLFVKVCGVIWDPSAIWLPGPIASRWISKSVLFFEFQKSWIFYFCEWNEIKRNTTEYVGNLGH